MVSKLLFVLRYRKIFAAFLGKYIIGVSSASTLLSGSNILNIGEKLTIRKPAEMQSPETVVFPDMFGS